MIEKRNLAHAFAGFDETWSPRIAGEINEMHLKLAKLEGAFVWHSHAQEDELFLVVRGRLRLEFRNQPPVVLETGEFLIVPHGVEHRPVAEEPCEVVLLEPKGTLNTGDRDDDPRTVRELQRL